MFRNLIAYRITDIEALRLKLASEAAELRDWDDDTASAQTDISLILAEKPFVPCEGSAGMSCGWVPPRESAPDLFDHYYNAAHLITLQFEQKLLPASVVNQVAGERIAKIVENEMRRIGKKERREIRDRVTEELLPKAFARRSTIQGILDLKEGWLFVNAASPGKADLFTQILRETIGMLPIRFLQTELDPVTAMTTWLEHGAPEGFTLDADVTLQAPGDGGAKVTISRHDLSAEEVTGHLKSGKLVHRLAMTHDDNVSFVLTDKLTVKRLALTDMKEDELISGLDDADDADDADAVFENTYIVQVGAYRALTAAVLGALGGELQA